MPEIYRYTRVLKDLTCSTGNMLPFSRISGCVIVDIVNQTMMSLKAPPPKIGVSNTLIPHAIKMGTTLDYRKL